MKSKLQWIIFPPTTLTLGASDSRSASTIEESLAAQEEFALAAMKALYHIVCESNEAVNSVLVGQEEKDSEKPSESRLHQPQSKDPSSTAGNACDEPQSPTPLLTKMFQLVDLTFVSNACQKESIINLSLRILCALAERAEEKHLWRYTSGQGSKIRVKMAPKYTQFQNKCVNMSKNGLCFKPVNFCNLLWASCIPQKA